MKRLFVLVTLGLIGASASCFADVQDGYYNCGDHQYLDIDFANDGAFLEEYSDDLSRHYLIAAWRLSKEPDIFDGQTLHMSYGDRHCIYVGPTFP